MSALYSQSFNFGSFLHSGVDPRTGQFTTSVAVYDAPTAARNCPPLQLALSFNPMNNQNVGFGTGWSFNLSSYQHLQSPQVLSLSTGESYQVTETSASLHVNDQKLKSFQFMKDPASNHQHLVIYKSGEVEVLSNKIDQRTYNTTVPVQLFGANGRGLTLEWTGFGLQPRLKSISDGDQTLLSISYGDSKVSVVRAPGTKEQSTFTFTLKNSRLAQVQGPLESMPPWKFDYDIVDKFVCLTKATSPTGLQEEVVISKNGQGHKLPPGAPFASVPYVKLYRVRPGHQQPEIDTTYDYSKYNFLGYGILNDWKKGQDNLYRVRSDYEYTCTVTVTDGATSKYTYNRFHLLTRLTTLKGNKKVTQETTYYMENTAPFDQQPAQYQLPKSVKTTFTDTSSQSCRSETMQHAFDEWGNPIQTIEKNGVQTDREYYPAAGADGCPADPHGFPRYMKLITVTPASSGYQSSVRSRKYTYGKYETPLSPSASYFVAVQTIHSYENGGELANSAFVYTEAPKERNNGRRLQVTTQVANKYPVVTKWAYQYSGSETLTLRSTTETYDGNTQQNTAELSMSSGLVRSHEDASGIQTQYVYDAMGQIIEKTGSLNSVYQATETYDHSVLINDVGYALTTKDPKGIQTRYTMDGLGRLCLVEKQDVDGVDNISNAVFRIVGERTYNSIGQCIYSATVDWLRGSGGLTSQKLSQSMSYDDWGQLYRVTEGTGVIKSLAVDPINQIHTSGIEGQGKIRSRLDDFGNPISTYLLKSDGSPYAMSTQYYDGLGRLRERQDPLGRVTQCNYDDFGRVNHTTWPNGQTLEVAYANETSSSWPTSVKTNNYTLGEQTFDGIGRATKQQIGGRITCRAFDDCSPKPSTVTTSRGGIWYLDYEPKLGFAVLNMDSHAENDAFQYDPTTGASTRHQNAFSTRSAKYLPSGLLLQDTIGVDNGPTFSMQYSYTMAGKVQSYVDPHGNTSNMEYDTAGRLKQIKQGTLSVEFSYDQFNRLLQSSVQDASSNSSLTTQLSYDDFSREISRKVSNGGKILHQLTQFYLETGHLATRRLEDGSGQLLLEEDFEYDELDRLVNYQCQGSNLPLDEHGNQIKQQAYSFGPYHNLTQVSTDFQDGTKNVATYAYENQDATQISRISNTQGSYSPHVEMQYDQGGCLLRDENGNKLAYDDMNRLTEVRDAQNNMLSQYCYDAVGKLICQKVPGGEDCHLHYRDSILIGYTQGSRKVSFLASGEHYWGQTLQDGGGQDRTQLWASDFHNSISAWIDTTKPNETGSQTFSPYGYTVPDTTWRPAIGFNGEWRDPITGWYHLGNGYRVYNPTLKVFHSPDSWSPFLSGEINAYGYCLGDPINNVDPSGHFSLFGIKFTWRDFAIAVVGIAVSLAVGVLTAGAGFAIEAGVGIAAGIASDVVTGAVYDEASGKTPTLQSMGTDALTGAIGGIGGEGLGKVVGTAGKAVVRGAKGLPSAVETFARTTKGLLPGTAERAEKASVYMQTTELHVHFRQHDNLVGKGPPPPPTVDNIRGFHALHEGGTDAVKQSRRNFHAMVNRVHQNPQTRLSILGKRFQQSPQPGEQLWYRNYLHTSKSDVVPGTTTRIEHGTFERVQLLPDGGTRSLETFHVYESGYSRIFLGDEGREFLHYFDNYEYVKWKQD